MMLVFLIILIIAGASSRRLSYRPFLLLLPVALGAYVVKALSVAQAWANMGEDGSWVWRPAVMAANIAFTYAIYGVFYLAGHAFGRWRRRRKSRVAHAS
jgi:hypothetical protein